MQTEKEMYTRVVAYLFFVCLVGCFVSLFVVHFFPFFVLNDNYGVRACPIFMHRVEKVQAQESFWECIRLGYCSALNKSKAMSKWAKNSLQSVTKVKLSMHHSLCLPITHTWSTNVNALDDSAAHNRSPAYCVTPKGTVQSMEKKNGKGLGHLTVKHKQITFWFAPLDTCCKSISYAVEKKTSEFATRKACSHSVLG